MESTLQCPECRKLFNPYKYGQRFCRPECRKAWHAERVKRLLEIGRQHLSDEAQPQAKG